MNKYLDFLEKSGAGGAHPGGLKITKKILSKMEMNPFTNILEVGCGTGQTMSYIAQQYPGKIVGVDILEGMVEKANQRFRKLDLPIRAYKGEAESLPFEKNSFDYVLSESVLIFTDLDLSLLEINRVLKEKGQLIAVEMVVEKKISNNDLERIKNFYGFKQMLAEKEWNRKFRSAGFIDIQFEKYEVPKENVKAEELPDLHFWENMDEKMWQLLVEHQDFLEKYSDVFGVRIITCRKETQR